MQKEQFDVFIAYHGTYESGGSFSVAKLIADYLLDKGLKVFFYPYSERDAYKTNIFQVINSTTLLLVASENIHRTPAGKIDYKNHYELSVELDSFYSSTFLDGNAFKSPLDSKVIFCGQYNDDFIKGDESKLHELFKDRIHFSCDKNNENQLLEEVYKWVCSRILLKKNGTGKYISSRLSNEVKCVYSKRTAMIDGERFNELISRANKIICIGISNSDLTSRIDQDAMFEFILNGGTIELYFLDPSGFYTAQREKEEQFDDERIKLTTENNLRIAKSFKDSLPEEYKNNYKILLYDISPRLNIIFIDDKLFLQFYGFISRGMDTPSFSILKQEEKSPLFDYCTKSYDFIKKNSKEL